MSELKARHELIRQLVIEKMKSAFKQVAVTSIAVSGLPENDQQWIATCLEWKPIRLVGGLDKSYIHFPDTDKALQFASEMEGKIFKNHVLEVEGIPTRKLSDFDDLMLEVKQTMQKYNRDLDYDITPSYGESCNCCGHAMTAHETPVKQMINNSPPTSGQE